MFVSYPAKYRDQFGEEATVVFNDGKILRMRVRTTELEGDDFDSLRPVSEVPAQSLLPSLTTGYLSSCIIECVIPVPIVFGDNILQGLLHAHLELGETEQIEGYTGCDLQLRLAFSDHNYVSTGKHSGFWDGELIDIQKLLPAGTYIKSCMNCALADIGRYQGSFGALGCYRGNKAAYFQFNESDWYPARKWELLELRTEDVQETYLCPEFEKRGDRVDPAPTNMGDIEERNT